MSDSKPTQGFRLFWSAEDQKWVGLSDAYPSLSCPAQTPEEAIRSIIKLQQETALDELAQIGQEMDLS